MLLRGFRYVQVLLLLCAVCCLSLAFPTQTPSAYDDVHSLQVTIPHSRQIFVPLGTSISIPCLVSLSSTPTTASSSSSPVVPRVKWTVVSNGVETQILVARGQRVKVNEAYRDRAALLNYTATPDDVSLWLGDLRSSDSGHYRCEVQQGLEDASDLVQLKVKGVVFHYRDALGRYTFSFLQAQRACESIGAEVATADQLLAAYYDGYEQCDAGWLADQSVRYPIQVPREACYGDMDGQPGVRNYGTMDPDDLFDVYCYVEQVDGEVFHDFVPQQLTFDEAQSYCRAAGAELATTAQLYAAWSEGLDRCSPGWLSDGSVRYPIITPRERCGGPQPGVKTVYRFSNQTGFPEPSSLHDVYCFKDHRITPTDIPMDYMATESESIDQDVVILREADEELHLNQHEDQVEREVLSELESFPIVSRPSETYNVPQNTSLLPSVNNETDSHQNLNDTSHHFEPANTTGLPKLSYEPFTDSKPETQPSERPKDSQETNFVLNKTLANYNETDSNHTQEENILKATVITPDIMMQVELEETAVTRPVPVSTDSPREEGEHQTLTTQAPIKTETSLFLPLDGSGDVSQESDIESVGDITTSESSTSDFTTQLPSSASPSSTTVGDGTALPDPTSSSGSQNTDKLGLDVFSTASAQLWESSISKQEGSTSLESEDKVSTESGEQLHLTTVETDLVSGVSLAATESPEGSRTPQLPTHFTTAQFQTSGYRVYLETATTAYEEASGQEPDTFTAILGEDVKIAPTPEENVTVIPVLKEEIKISPTVKEEAKPEHEVQVSPTLEDGITVTPNLEDGITVTPNLEYGITVTPNLEDGITVTPNLEDGITVTPSFEEEVTVVTVAAIHEERTTVAPMLEEVKIAPTIEEKVISSTLDEEEENGTSTTEEDDNVSSTIEEEANFASTIEEEANVTSTIEEEASVASTIEKEANVSLIIEEVNVTPTVEAEATDSTPIEEDANFSSTSGEQVKFAPTIEGDLTISPFDSQTSNLPLLTTTTEPQESLNDLEYDRKTSSITSTAAPDSPSSTKHSVATTQTITDTTKTTTHWSRRTWSPTTSTPRVFHKTTEPQKVTHLIPPVDQGLVDVEFSLTQPPTLLIMPNERAAVGGTGKVSDACLDDPCLNGGTCTDQDGQIKCLCLPTYGGDFCQTDLERCETGWDKFQGFCYRHFSQRLSWEVAEQHCRMQGAHLVSIMTPEEQSYINSNYKEYQWTGLNDKTIEDDFRWSDGNPLLYENWYKGQPDSYFLSGEDCVVMVWHDDGRWSDVPCNYHLAYTCKKGTSSCGPPPKVRNTSTFGKTRQRYETNAVIRYHCAKGFQQRLNPVIRCLSGGVWERPQIQCIPEGGGPTQNPEVTSPTDDNFAAAEDDFEATKAKPQYWDIKF